MRGRRFALVVTTVLGVMSACGRQLPPDQLGPQGAPADAGADGSSGRDAAPIEDGSSVWDALPGTSDASDASQTCTPCSADGGCCTAGQVCLAGECTACSGANQLCEGTEDCCTGAAKLICNVGLCCVPTGEPCTGATQASCCFGCNLASGKCG